MTNSPEVLAQDVSNEGSERLRSVPYIIAMESFEGDDGAWYRRAECPELPGCVVVSDSLYADDAYYALLDLLPKYLRSKGISFEA